MTLIAEINITPCTLTMCPRFLLKQIFKLDKLQSRRSWVLLRHEALNIPDESIMILVKLLIIFNLLNVRFQFLCVHFLLFWIEAKLLGFLLLFYLTPWRRFLLYFLSINIELNLLNINASYSKCFLPLENMWVFLFKMSHKKLVFH